MKLLAFAVGIPAIVVGVLQLLPRVSVVAQDPLDEHNPFIAPFVISNDGYIPLYDVQPICAPRHVQLVGIDGKGGQIVIEQGAEESEESGKIGGFTNPNFFVKRLAPSNKVAFPCQMALPPDFATNLAAGRVDILYTVTYRILGIPRHHLSHFSLSKDSRGQFHWLEEPLH